MLRTASRLLATLLAISLCTAGFAQSAPQSTDAPLISTESAAAALNLQARAQLHAALDRPELAAKLAQRGVTVEQARARVDALTDDEAQALQAQIDAAPAGASDVLGLIFTVFLILLVTDILGLTKVFPFTRSVR